MTWPRSSAILNYGGFTMNKVKNKTYIYIHKNDKTISIIYLKPLPTNKLFARKVAEIPFKDFDGACIHLSGDSPTVVRQSLNIHENDIGDDSA